MPDYGEIVQKVKIEPEMDPAAMQRVVDEMVNLTQESAREAADEATQLDVPGQERGSPPISPPFVPIDTTMFPQDAEQRRADIGRWAELVQEEMRLRQAQRNEMAMIRLVEDQPDVARDIPGTLLEKTREKSEVRRRLGLGDDVLGEWEDQESRLRMIERARRGESGAMIDLMRLDPAAARDLGRAAQDTETRIREIKEGLGLEDETREDRVALKHADAILQAGLRGAGGMASSIGLPGGLLSALGGAVATGSVGLGIAAVLGTTLGLGATEMAATAQESIEMDEIKRQLLLGNMGTYADYQISSDFRKLYAEERNLGVSSGEAGATMLAQRLAMGTTDFSTLMAAQRASEYMQAMAIPEDLAQRYAFRRGVPAMGAAEAAQMMFGFGDEIGPDDPQNRMLQEMQIQEIVRSAGYSDITSSMATDIREQLGGFYDQGSDFARTHAADLIGAFTRGAAAPAAGSRGYAFLARVFAQTDYADKSPQGFHDWMATVASTAAGRHQIAAMAQADAGPQWRLHLANLGLAPSTQAARFYDLPAPAGGDYNWGTEITEQEAEDHARVALGLSASGQNLIRDARRRSRQAWDAWTWPATALSRLRAWPSSGGWPDESDTDATMGADLTFNNRTKSFRFDITNVEENAQSANPTSRVQEVKH